MGQNLYAKPFLKWAGGKTQLLSIFRKYYPTELFEGRIKRYIEPFVGSGAVLFELIQNYDIDEFHILDINPELIINYLVIKKDVETLIESLKDLEKKYLSLDKSGRKQLYYEIRSQFNQNKQNFDFQNYSEKTIERASQFIFLNRTCYNGLFRVNKQGHFNVPMGNYKNPTICDESNLRAVSKALTNVSIAQGDYRECLNLIDENTLVYFDPPYRPLNTTSSFTSYCEFEFNDDKQIELARFYDTASKKGAFLMLSNSDPQNVNANDTFFEELYKGYNIYTEKAKRLINSKGEKRGLIN
ncbi:DNA adenine methylase [Desulforamulus ferrireducens]|uniref:Site-specific DNA-methyltransferase (adenine-specific) n=1 Tax=Desulforamulus ferrireducens TaxID=1833852 RepID=A0A1S6ITY6_9FIRM|nr:DNA adenine methylase [Desulforamulus ferrireducens]AQS58230.1 modification methylase [Desulforamulus ferrireducens]